MSKNFLRVLQGSDTQVALSTQQPSGTFPTCLRRIWTAFVVMIYVRRAIFEWCFANSTAVVLFFQHLYVTLPIQLVFAPKIILQFTSVRITFSIPISIILLALFFIFRSVLLCTSFNFLLVSYSVFCLRVIHLLSIATVATMFFLRWTLSKANCFFCLITNNTCFHNRYSNHLLSKRLVFKKGGEKNGNHSE